jgi:subtilisin family serine protease
LVLTLVLSSAGLLFAQDPRPDNLQVSAGVTPESQESLPNKEGKAAQPARTSSASGEELVSVIVKLDDASLAAYAGGIPGLAATSPEATGAPLDVQSRDSQLYLGYLAAKQDALISSVSKTAPSARVVYRYSAIIGGVSMLVPSSQVEAIAKLPGVQAVYEDKLVPVDTSNSPAFIGATALWQALGGAEDAGEGVIVGILDTGVWPEHPSFSDPDPSGESYDPPPGGPYACDFGNTAFNPNDAPFTCNNKLIGAYEFLDTFKVARGLTATEFDSARDANGHGTHTSSTAAGNNSVPASILGSDLGLISGMAPRAQVIMYKVCADINDGNGTASCYTTDSAAGVEQAILDGVNVLNFSVGGGSTPYNDVVSLAFLDAYNAGVFVAASAGNSGPGADTVDHREPWTTTVAASTQDKAYGSDLTLSADNGDTLTVHGASIVSGIDTPTPIVYAGDFGDALCEDATPDGTFTGVVVLCDRGVIARVAKSGNVQARGAVGMVLRNLALQGTATDNHFIPSIHVEFDAGADVFDFMTTHTGVLASWTDGAAEASQGDVMAAFSSRGGPGQTLGISKPDVTAPGVQILAGHTPLPVTIAGGAPGQLFQVIQGTSMSSPHVAGAAALLKDLHPDWTPGQIKSALMTTARLINVVKEDGVTPVDPFDVGSGRIDLRKAGNPGITFSATGQDFLDHEADLWNANYPSLYVPVMPGRATVERTAHSELNYPSIWRLTVSDGPDFRIIVPRYLIVPKGGDASFEITIDAPNVPLGEVRHGFIGLTFGSKRAVIPVSFVRNQPVVTLETSCDPSTVERGGITTCNVVVSNTSFDTADVDLTGNVSKRLQLIPGSVIGVDEDAIVGGHTSFSLYGAEPPGVSMSVAPWGNGYLPLSAFGVAPIAGVGDETIVNFGLSRPFLFGGKSWTSIGIVSNGYAVVGGGTSADINYLNQTLPDAAPPNNVLAPFWTDLNPAAGGALRIAYLSSAGYYWLVLDWEGVPNWGNGLPNSFQIWIGSSGVEDIAYAYGPDLSAGDGGLLTVGAENEFGNRGVNWYVNGVGTLPLPLSDDLVVSSIPGAPGETRSISAQFQTRGIGPFNLCAEITSNLFFGTNISCTSGEIVP